MGLVHLYVYVHKITLCIVLTLSHTLCAYLVQNSYYHMYALVGRRDVTYLRTT